MAGLFSKPKSPKLYVPPPAAIPEVDKDRIKKTRKPAKSRYETIITGELEPVSSKKSLLG